MQKLGFESYYKLPVVQKISQKTKQPPCVIVAGFLLIFVVLMFSPLGSMITTSVTFLIPAYKTFKALETKDASDDKKMLTFWIAFGFIYLFDNVFSCLFSFLYFYHIFRSALIMYLYIPRFDGATKLYDRVIHPLFEKYSGIINQYLEPIERRTEKVSQQLKKNR